jgi:hypothetical protein
MVSLDSQKAASPIASTLVFESSLPEQHPTATVYLDESGVISRDRFFGIGCLRVVDGPRLTRELRGYRERLGHWDELHWARLDKAASRHTAAFDMARAAVNTFFELDGASFCCTVSDRQNGDPTKSYGSSWKAYEGLAKRALTATICGSELVTVLADHADTPSHVRFEESVRTGVNREKGRLAIATVTRIHSHAADGLQLADLLLGATMFDFRQGANQGTLDPSSQKGRLCAHVLERCNFPSFRPAGKEISGKFKVEMRDRRRRTRRRRRGGDPT